jgi:ABC-type transporter Mla MlaB component
MALIEGELTQWTVPGHLTRAGELAAVDVLDLSSVTRADSAAVAFLLELRRRKGAPLQLSGAPAQLEGLLDFFAVRPLLTTAEG